MPQPSNAPRSKRIRNEDWLILVGLSVVWGSSFILIKKGIVSFQPEEMAVLRIVITSIAFIPIFFTSGHGFIPTKKLPWAAAIGVLGSGLPAFLYAYAETVVPSSVAGILNSLTPIFTWVIGLIFFGMVYTKNHMVGMVLGLVGAIVIVMVSPDFRLEIHPMTLLLIVATVSYGLSANIVQSKFQDTHPITLSSIAFFFVGVPAFIYSFQTDIYHTISTNPESWYSLGAIVLLSLIGTVMANVLFYRLIQNTNAVFASSVAYLIPIMALGWGLLDGEILQWPHLIGMVLILFGIFVLRKH